VSLEPLHWSSVHALPSEVQLVPEVDLVSAGQAAVEPVHFSTASHSPAALRHTVLLLTNESAGQTVDAPVHVSAMSQVPAEPRQVVPALPAVCWQVSLEPLH
jgi:hypothetical protein